MVNSERHEWTSVTDLFALREDLAKAIVNTYRPTATLNSGTAHAFLPAHQHILRLFSNVQRSMEDGHGDAKKSNLPKRISRVIRVESKLITYTANSTSSLPSTENINATPLKLKLKN